MSKKESETVEDIVSLMRDKDYYRGYMGATNRLTDRMVANLIDRIETAHKREVSELMDILKLAMTKDRCLFSAGII